MALAKPDAYVRGLIEKNPNLSVPHFLIHSYLYYELDSPIVTDATFDFIVERLGAEWDNITHRHKMLLDRSILKTGYYVTHPGIVKGAATALVKMFEAGSGAKRKTGRKGL